MKDIHIIRELAAEYAQAANSDQNREKIRLHTAVKDLQMIRPIVLIDEIPWGEMAIGEELTLRCEDEDGTAKLYCCGKNNPFHRNRRGSGRGAD